jgi:DNA-binding response OmpR family regulator
LTDTEKSEERIHAIKIGAEYILSKPFNPVELSLRVKSRTGLINKKIQNVA